MELCRFRFFHVFTFLAIILIGDKELVSETANSTVSCVNFCQSANRSLIKLKYFTDGHSFEIWQPGMLLLPSIWINISVEAHICSLSFIPLTFPISSVPQTFLILFVPLYVVSMGYLRGFSLNVINSKTAINTLNRFLIQDYSSL